MILVNFVVKRSLPGEWDLTENKLYTITEGTENILGKLDTPVTLRFFATRDKDIVPESVSKYRVKVLTYLKRLQKLAPKEMFEIETYDPEPDSQDERSAKDYGIQRLSVDPAQQQYFYLGLAIESAGKEEAIGFLDPGAEPLLEYHIMRAISEVTVDEKPKIGVMSSLQLAGVRSRQQRGAFEVLPWVVYYNLQRSYQVVDLGLDIDKVDDDVDLVVLIHAAGITEKGQFALDQFVLRGGRLLAFLDAHCEAAQSGPAPPPQFGQPPPPPQRTSDLNKLLPAWGLEFESNRAVADLNFGRRDPVALTVSTEGIAKTDVLTSEYRDLRFMLSGVFLLVDEMEDSEFPAREVLVHTTETSQLIGTAAAQEDPAAIRRDFESSKTGVRPRRPVERGNL